jgi:[ribosomal protein S5]-alanine N-acetyltransferase
MGALPFATDRLLLRRFRESDLARFQACRRDPEVGRYQGWTATDDARAAAFIATMAVAPIGVPGEWFQIAIADSTTGALIGDIGVCVAPDSSRAAEIGFSIAPAAQGHGLGTEAVKGAVALLFESGMIDVVAGITDARNVRSIKLLQRVGMCLDRIHETLFRGEPCSEHVYTLTLAQWTSNVATHHHQ